MNIPILVSALGSSPTALATYKQVDMAIRNHFIDREIHWSYTLKRMREIAKSDKESAYPSPQEALSRLMARGIDKVLVQSLHLLPGTEFHDLQKTLRSSGIRCGTGMPLLCTPDDYNEIGEIMRPVIASRPDKAILLLGHGTAHPIWTAYCCLETFLRHKFGERIFVGVLEKFPDCQDLPAAVRAAGFTEICIIPFLMVAGMHYHRDIAGNDPSSWMTRLSALGLTVEVINHGMGLFSGINGLIIRHIEEGLQAFK